MDTIECLRRPKRPDRRMALPLVHAVDEVAAVVLLAEVLRRRMATTPEEEQELLCELEDCSQLALAELRAVLHRRRAAVVSALDTLLARRRLKRWRVRLDEPPHLRTRASPRADPDAQVAAVLNAVRTDPALREAIYEQVRDMGLDEDSA